MAQSFFVFKEIIGYQYFYFKNFSQLSKFLVFTCVIFFWLFSIVLINQLLNLFCSNNEVGNMHSRTCAFKIFHSWTIFFPISFLQKCGLIYCIYELKGRLFYIFVLVVKAYIWGVLKAMPTKIGQRKYHIKKKNWLLGCTHN